VSSKIADQIGNYRVVRQLGQGGMGTVFEAVRDGIGGRVALKVLRAEYTRNPDVASRFFQEARAANLIEHPGVVKIYEYGQLPDGTAFLAMEYLEGQSLRAVLAKSKRLPQADVLRLCRQMAGALAAAHGKQIVHRDLKPDNIMLIADAEAPGGERAKILDFGIAKVAELHGAASPHTRTGMILGTPVYMSPEQCRGAGQVGDRSDVYALGVVMYHMLAGRPPFVGESDFDLMANHIYSTPPPLATLCPGVAKDIVRLVESMLRKEPAARPSMSEVVIELQGVSSRHGWSSVSLPAGVPPHPRRSPGWRVRLGVASALLLGALVAYLVVWRDRSPTAKPRSVAQAKQVPQVRGPQPTRSSMPGTPGTQGTQGTQGSPGSSHWATEPEAVAPSPPEAHAAGKTREGRPAKGIAAAKPKEGKDALQAALDEYLAGRFAKALKLAQQHQKQSPDQAWRIIGSSACHLKKLALLNQAYHRVDEGGQRYILLVCRDQGVTRSSSGEFQAAK
jgi:serine/threonine protein kinase